MKQKSGCHTQTAVIYEPQKREGRRKDLLVDVRLISSCTSSQSLAYCRQQMKCAKQVKLHTLNQHCSTHQSQFSHHVTLEDIIQLPLDVEPSVLEKRAATSLMSRLLHHQQDDTISLPRKGQVSCINIIKQKINYMYLLYAS